MSYNRNIYCTRNILQKKLLNSNQTSDRMNKFVNSIQLFAYSL